MDASDILRLLSASHYSPADLEQVNGLCRNYPMFSLGHVLRARIMEALGQPGEKELRMAALYAPDRRVLQERVREVTPREEPEPVEVPGEPEGIRFSEEPHQEADVIIEQHAPYAGGEPADSELLELDEEDGEQDPEQSQGADPDEEEEISSETLIEKVAKDDVDLESEGAGEDDTPPVGMVEPAPESEPVSETEAEAETQSEPVSVPKAERKPEPKPVSEPKAGPDPGSEPHANGSSLGNRLILNFIKEDPGPIRADAAPGIKGDISLDSIREHDGLITDTLAQIYVKQGLYAKAIYAYERLSLKYPEKSAYFAAQIEKIRNINHS